MNDTVKVILDEKEYELIYNEQTECYEGNLNAPNQPGLHILEVVYNSNNEIATANEELVVLKQQDIKYSNEEVIGYFLDWQTFEVSDVVQLSINEINRDLETNGTSTFSSSKKINTKADDFIFLKKSDSFNFLGIVTSIQDDKSNLSSKAYIINCKDILSMFDIDMFVENEGIISSIGIEDFLKEMIIKEFINNTDSFVNREYLIVEAKSHTKKNIKISSVVSINNNIYNFLTFINNCIEKYDINFDFKLEKNKIKIDISAKSEEKKLIDSTTSDITNYSETFSLSYVAKVEVKNKENNNIYYRYLLNDRTTTTDKNDSRRIAGTTEKITVEKEADSEQASLDVFKGNSYKHNISFDINKYSNFHDVKDLALGTPILVKTTNAIYDTYISKIKDIDNKFLSITCGNLRVDYIDKYLQERRKNK